MERYIGLDVHSTNCTCVVPGPSGRKTKEVVLETSSKALREFVRTVRRPHVVVMEEGNQSEWLYEILSPVTDEVMVIQPERRHGNKRDDLDAERRARLARMNEPGRRIYKAPRQIAALRQAAKAYRIAQRDLTRVQARLKMATADARERVPRRASRTRSPRRTSSFGLRILNRGCHRHSVPTPHL